MEQTLQTNVLAFSPRFSPDPDSGRRIHGLGDLSDEDCARAMQQSRGQQDAWADGKLPPHLMRLDSMAVAGCIGDRFVLQRLDSRAGEASLLADFYRRLAHEDTLMLSYQGNAITPILRCRALLAGVPLSGRAHLDIAEWLAGPDACRVPLQEMVLQTGLPAIVAEPPQAVPEEVSAVQIYLLYLRLQRLRGLIGRDAAEKAENQVRVFLQDQDAPFWRACLSCWDVT